METTFKGKRALVTGAGKGIGRATAVHLAKLGASVIAISRTQTDLDELMAEVPSVETRCLDINRWDDTEKVLEDIGRVDLLVNNAAVNALKTLFDVTEADFDNVHGVNVKAAFHITQIVAKGMISRGNGGAIVNVSSVSGMRAVKAVETYTLYCSSKAALDMLTMNFAVELGPYQIRVNSVNPTVVMTKMGKAAWGDPQKAEPLLSRIPLGRFAEVEDVVNAITFLLSDKASMINGVLMPVDGGSIVRL